MEGSGCDQYESYLSYTRITEGTEENHEFKIIRNRSPDQVDFKLDHLNIKQEC